MLTASSMSASITPAETPSACRKPNEPSSSSWPTVTTRIESGMRRRLARQQADHDVALLVEAARDAADERDLQLLGAAEVVLGQRQHRDARPPR